MKALIYIRMEQIKQIFLKGGIQRRVILIAVIIYSFIALPLVLTQNPILYMPLPFLLVLLTSLTRKDSVLLRKTGMVPAGVYFVEYIFISTPFLITGFAMGHWQGLIVYLILILILALTSGIKLLQLHRKFPL